MVSEDIHGIPFERLDRAFVVGSHENDGWQMVRAGGGFGRRADNDSMCEAAWISMNGGPPLSMCRAARTTSGMITIIAAGFQYLKAAVDHTGKIVAWKDTSSRMAKSTNSSTTAGFNAGEFPAGYIENFLVQASTMPLGLETGALRAPGSNRIAWVMPSFIDDWRTPPAKIWQLERSLSVLRRDPSKSDRHPVGIVIASKSEL